MGFSIPVSNFHLIVEGGGEQNGQGLLVLPPHCEIVLVRTLKHYTRNQLYSGGDLGKN